VTTYTFFFADVVSYSWGAVNMHVLFI